MQQLKPQRKLGPDLVRIAACFAVLSVHFFLNNGFYSEPVEGAAMFIMVLMRSSFMVCVPLFLLLTGYLMRNKKLEKSYYAKGAKTLAVYILASVACILYKLIHLKTGEPLKAALSVLNYTGAPYGWYIEMYIGLFLLIPFLNILYHGLPGRGAKKALLGTLLFLTALPSVLNVYEVTNAAWWSMPSSSAAYQQLIPQWWRGVYPLTYYYLGAYIGEYGVRLPAVSGKLFTLAALLFNGLYNYWRSRGGNFIWGNWNDWGSLFNVVCAVLVFMLLVHKDGARRPALYRAAVAAVSDLTLGIYLTSYIFDSLFYPMLKQRVPTMQDRLPYYFAIVPLVFLCSLVLSGVIELIWLLGSALMRRCRAKLRERKQTAEKNNRG